MLCFHGDPGVLDPAGRYDDAFGVRCIFGIVPTGFETGYQPLAKAEERAAVWKSWGKGELGVEMRLSNKLCIMAQTSKLAKV